MALAPTGKEQDDTYPGKLGCAILSCMVLAPVIVLPIMAVMMFAEAAGSIAITETPLRLSNRSARILQSVVLSSGNYRKEFGPVGAQTQERREVWERLG